jgi:hypothetical protein
VSMLRSLFPILPISLSLSVVLVFLYSSYEGTGRDSTTNGGSNGLSAGMEARPKHDVIN